MTGWVVEYAHEALDDLKSLDHTQRLQVLKAIQKVSRNPLPNSEGGYGKPLGNHISSRLAGYFKIKLLKIGLRVIYNLVRDGNIMRVIVISVRDDETAYKLARKRIN